MSEDKYYDTVMKFCLFLHRVKTLESTGGMSFEAGATATLTSVLLSLIGAAMENIENCATQTTRVAQFLRAMSVTKADSSEVVERGAEAPDDVAFAAAPGRFMHQTTSALRWGLRAVACLMCGDRLRCTVLPTFHDGTSFHHTQGTSVLTP
jgi:hypothetical protein